MAANISTTEPKRLRLGDTWRWQKSLSDYSADTWTLTYVCLDETGSANKITINTTANGSAHEVNVSADTTANYTAANYKVIGYVSDGTNRYSLDELDGLRFEVKADPATAASADERTFAEKMVANLETAMTSLSTGTLTQASENGKSYTVRNLDELNRDIGYWKQVVWAENTKKQIQRGYANPNLIRAKFTRPR